MILLGRKSFGVRVGSNNLADCIGRNRFGEVREEKIEGFTERLVPFFTWNRGRIIAVFRILIACVIEDFEESEWTLEHVSKLGIRENYEEMKVRIKNLEKEEGKTKAVKMFELYQKLTWKSEDEKKYRETTEKIRRLVKQYLLLEKENEFSI